MFDWVLNVPVFNVFPMQEKKEKKSQSCKTSVWIRSFLWSTVSHIRTEYGDYSEYGIYSVNLHIQFNGEKWQTRKNTEFPHFSRSAVLNKASKHFLTHCENAWNTIKPIRNPPFVLRSTSFLQTFEPILFLTELSWNFYFAPIYFIWGY